MRAYLKHKKQVLARGIRRPKRILAIGLLSLVGFLLPTHIAFAFVSVAALGSKLLLGALKTFGLVGGTGLLAYLFGGEIVEQAFKIVVWLAGLLTQVLAALMQMSGKLLDFVILKTILENPLKQTPTYEVVEIGWIIIRDVANMFFVFLFLYVAISIILQIEKVNAKRMLATLIIVALLINFSSFFVRFGVDISNIFALQFYDLATAVSTPAPSTFPSTAGSSGGASVSISFSIMQALGLSEIFSNDFDAELRSQLPADPANPEGVQREALLFAYIYLSIIFGVTAWVFFQGALLFILRTIVFMFGIVLAPMAFVLAVIPQTQQYFQKWVTWMVKFAVIAPVYLFFLYLIIQLFRLSTETTAQNITPSLEDIAALFNFVLVIGLLIMGLKVSKGIAGEAGTKFLDLGNKALATATGTGAGLALGGVGRAGRNTLGRAATRMTENKELREKAAQGSVRAKMQLRAAGALAGSSYDFRNTKGGQVVGEQARGRLGVNLGKGGGAGGFRKVEEQEGKRREEFAEKVIGTDPVKTTITDGNGQQREIQVPANIAYAMNQLGKKGILQQALGYQAIVPDKPFGLFDEKAAGNILAKRRDDVQKKIDGQRDKVAKIHAAREDATAKGDTNRAQKLDAEIKEINNQIDALSDEFEQIGNFMQRKQLRDRRHRYGGEKGDGDNK